MVVFLSKNLTKKKKEKKSVNKIDYLYPLYDKLETNVLIKLPMITSQK